MSESHVQQIIANAVINTEYREMLFNEPDKALEGFELTEEERTALIDLDRQSFDATASEMEDRISRAGFGFVSPGSHVGFNPQPEPPGGHIKFDDFFRVRR